jgi:uncharacterized protein YbjT (DUF2867 family)
MGRKSASANVAHRTIDAYNKRLSWSWGFPARIARAPTERSVMKIVVIGGSGLIGSQLVKKLRDRGHEVVAASPRSGVNAVTGEGLAQALEGAQVVVDVANSPSFEDGAAMSFFENAGRNLAAAEKKAGVKHHVALSVVGTDRLLESGYFRAKLAQEDLIKKSGIPFTIVHATQFFEFIGAIAQAATVGQTVRLPSALMQPIASADLAAAMADFTLSNPANGIVEVAGPEPIQIDEIARQLLREQGDPREVITDDSAPYYGIRVNQRSLMPGEGARLTTTRFADWLHQAGSRPQAVR